MQSTGDLHVYKTLTIQSHKGPYHVSFQENISLDTLTDDILQKSHVIIDKTVAEIYKNKLSQIQNAQSVLYIEATEQNKSLEQFPQYISHLVSNKIRRNHQLIAIGGGIIQDITCFLAATLLRGVNWWFIPTTLLAQADSCIGSKSSINCAGAKNILGTFTPPNKILIYTEFLQTLGVHELHSGIGEMIKVHAINGAEALNKISLDYDNLFTNQYTLLQYLKRSLEIKKDIIEQDEFDQHIRNIMNYGHTFGHAIEAATQYAIPHGIAVTIGMDMANYLASKYDSNKQTFYKQMHPILKRNYQAFSKHTIPFDIFLNAISKDKKNEGKNSISAILPDELGQIRKIKLDNNDIFQQYCSDYLLQGREQ